jgi:hypothetical protein
MGADLATAILFVADDLERRGYPFAGAVRQAARRLTELEPLHATNGCELCGRPLDQKRFGRPRRWCSERCRKRGGNAKLSEVNRNRESV